MKKILYVGDSLVIYSTYVVGHDQFFTSTYTSEEHWLKKALEDGGYEVTYLPNHDVNQRFPYEMDDLTRYDCVILSDIGSNTFLIPDESASKCEFRPNRCDLIRDYVQGGGSLLMIGGYLTFTGIDGKGRWGTTSVQEVLPITMLDVDDRREHCEGIVPKVETEHPALNGIEGNWPRFLGYNKLIAKPGADVPVSICGDPMIALIKSGKGRSAVFASDCAPHWGTYEFVNWKYYKLLWQGIAGWLTNG